VGCTRWRLVYEGVSEGVRCNSYTHAAALQTSIVPMQHYSCSVAQYCMHCMHTVLHARQQLRWAQRLTTICVPFFTATHADVDGKLGNGATIEAATSPVACNNACDAQSACLAYWVTANSDRTWQCKLLAGEFRKGELQHMVSCRVTHRLGGAESACRQHESYRSGLVVFSRTAFLSMITIPIMHHFCCLHSTHATSASVTMSCSTPDARTTPNTLLMVRCAAACYRCPEQHPLRACFHQHCPLGGDGPRARQHHSHTQRSLTSICLNYAGGTASSCR
jgi:hypothetical protein